MQVVSLHCLLLSVSSLLPTPTINKKSNTTSLSKMGGKGAPLSPSPSPSSSICCMCGDHGLPQELFRCKSCHFRSQHKYCSDLYPRADAYRACNWCLREIGGRPLLREPAAAGNNRNPILPSSSSENTNGGGGTGAVKLNRGSFPSHLNKPVKKQQMHRRSLSDVNDRMGSRQAFRGKVRRYKLLEEVSS